MRCRPVSDEGDMIPVQRGEQMLTETDAVAGAMYSRLKFNYGEWWEDRTVGFSVPRFLMEGLRGGKTAQTLMGYISAYILKTPGATTIASSSYEIVGRTMYANFLVNTEYGEQVEWRVDIDGLLGSVS